MRTVLAKHGQSGVGHARQPDACVPGKVTQVLAHLGRAGGAVQSDEVDAERLESRKGGPDLRAEEHRAGRLDRHVDEDRKVGSRAGERPLGADDGRLGLQQVLGGLDEDGVDPADGHAGDLLVIGVAESGVGDVAERRQLGARADRADHPAGPLGRRPRVRGLPGDPGARLGQLEDPVADVVLAEVGEVGAEGVGLDAVDADLEIGVVNGADDVGPGDVQDLVAALVALEVLE